MQHPTADSDKAHQQQLSSLLLFLAPFGTPKKKSIISEFLARGRAFRGKWGKDVEQIFKGKKCTVQMNASETVFGLSTN